MPLLKLPTVQAASFKLDNPKPDNKKAQVKTLLQYAQLHHDFRSVQAVALLLLTVILLLPLLVLLLRWGSRDLAVLEGTTGPCSPPPTPSCCSAASGAPRCKRPPCSDSSARARVSSGRGREVDGGVEFYSNGDIEGTQSC
ncbi:hypothetical protein ACP4OV_028082 [Aristida adscensionis]